MNPYVRIVVQMGAGHKSRSCGFGGGSEFGMLKTVDSHTKLGNIAAVQMGYYAVPEPKNDLQRPYIQMLNEIQHIRDESLVLRVRANPDDFGVLVDRWHAVLWRHAYRLTQNRESAWDAVQEAWLAIFRSLHSIEDPAAFPKWAFRIVTNKCRDHARQARRQEAAMAAYKEQSVALPASATSNERLATALTRLEPELRTLVALYYEDSFTVREIGEITGSPEGSVKSRLYRARQELRRMMEETEHGVHG